MRSEDKELDPDLRVEIKTARSNGALLGELLNRYDAREVVQALGVIPIAGDLGLVCPATGGKHCDCREIDGCCCCWCCSTCVHGSCHDICEVPL